MKKILLTIGVLIGNSMFGQWEVLEDSQGRKLEGRILEVGETEVTLVRKADGQKFSVAIEKFSDEAQARFKTWKEEKETAAEEAGISKKLYPRSKEEIKETLQEISKREAPSGIDEEQHKVVTELNIYRYLSGVSYDVEADPELVENAMMAAAALKKAGKLSHDLGDYTDKCNISTLGSMLKTVQQYINDPGDTNRVHRGHRRWCLNAPMGKTGFGTGGKKYSAMWAMDSSGERIDESWAYPGKGFFPIERLHGPAWSLYLNESAPDPGDLEVEVSFLSKRPEKPIGFSDSLPGKKMPVPYVKTYLNAINFEPDEKPVTEKGIYYVRIKGDGVREQYLVELY